MRSRNAHNNTFSCFRQCIAKEKVSRSIPDERGGFGCFLCQMLYMVGQSLAYPRARLNDEEAYRGCGGVQE
jgi:hypothetical protein